VLTNYVLYFISILLTVSASLSPYRPLRMSVRCMAASHISLHGDSIAFVGNVRFIRVEHEFLNDDQTKR